MTDLARSETHADAPRPGTAPLTSVAEVDTHCPYCALQCGMTLRATPERVEVRPRQFPTNRGGLCQKGWTAAELLDHPDRLTTPLVRDRPTGQLRPASWDEALDRVTDSVTALQAAHGRDSVAVFGGGGLTNEKAYALGKFARVALRTRQIDYNGRFCMSSAAAAGNRAFGVDRGLPFPLADLARADTLLLVGANVAETMPPLVRYLVEQKQRGGTLIVIDPRATATARQATLHLQPMPGTDLAVANALLHIALAEGWIDREYVEDRTAGFDAVRRSVAGYWPAQVERLSGVPVADLEAAARALGTAGTAIILTARGAEQHTKGVDTVTAFINLALALGLPGRPGSGYGCLTGQGNGQGGREHGQKADQLPGYRRIDDPAARAHVAGVWGVRPDDLPGPGLSAYELLDSIGSPEGPRALLVFGSNPVVSAPRAGRIQRRLADLDLLVVADFVLSETAAMADVVLPTAQWAEEDGTMTNLEGRVLRRRALRPPPTGVRTDLAVIAELARRLGATRPVDADADADGPRFPDDPRLVFDELRRASAGGIADYAGVTWERIDAENGLFWPCPAPERPDTPRLFTATFPTLDGRARFVPVEHRPAAEEVCPDYPLYLTTGRVLAQYQSGAQTRRIAPLRTAAPNAFLELHPDLAQRLGVVDGDEVRISSRRGEMRAPARLSDTIRADTVFAPFHWAGAARANSLTNDALDPTSRMPEFKICAVRVERA
ncbi:assimilatory nitrate reductase (NADH) alpha subunit apoprotein [Micromonospora pisi]|uniref:Assimilatory nitrate reductase (NADH) alpha subunit apoprotein n=1 Tax=Micromonospora pisi TaxID=589240 RepID=A0A495JM87_9ACTN|nr:molybdopterin oxidoreductase family protein [Micromonospora pisi]RKR90126.1 assimilatory nitrate reductase (NADH) alpha subunit apoprotein [Micromonospora pisi]